VLEIDDVISERLVEELGLTIRKLDDEAMVCGVVLD
jgi:hypothetical protein